MDRIADLTIERAARLVNAALAQQTPAERAASAQMAGLMNDPAGKQFTLAMADRVFRSRSPARQAEQVRRLLRQYGVPQYLPWAQKLMLRAGAVSSSVVPDLVMPAMQGQLRRESERVILDAEPVSLDRYLDRRHADRMRVNLNHLGEAILGEGEARRRLDAVLHHLANPKVDYVSVKISAIYSQVHVLDFDHTVTVLADRLRTLYRAAIPTRKFVNLDMEEYRDLALTLAAFQAVLREPEFMAMSAGVVLQGYLPDSWLAQQQLTDWARERVADGGAPIKVRLVKGANLAMERVEAELHGWTPAPYATKAETDANYRRMIEYGCQPAHAAAVRIGVASHNLFDVALALELRERHGVADRVELEMLEGMANHQAWAARDEAGAMLLYAPVVSRDDFLGALAYLVRRLDENTSPENYLHDLFDLRPGSDAWERQKNRFIEGWDRRNDVSSRSRRETPQPVPLDASFFNVADTDWTQPARRAALQASLVAWQTPTLPPLRDTEAVLHDAVASQPGWAERGFAARAAILRSAAEAMEAARFDTIAQMMQEGKKAAIEADVEVSEAIDFARYAAATDWPAEGVVAEPLGVVLITPPWNFPYAIPCGGVTAALAAGNSVILKPAPETVGIAWLLANHLWQAGVPREVLQFHPIADGEAGKALVTDPRVAAVVLTGAYETARMFLNWRPELRLFAETSGKNAIVITAQADRDLAIKDLVKSAFGHAGQKCSAASLAILEAEVYDDPAFLRALRDAAASLKVGDATDLGSVVTPLIRDPSPSLHRALTTLDPGENWLLQPGVDTHDPCLWSPGIKLGVRPGSWFHQTECFGPVLGLMRARDLDEAIHMQNATPYGLTGGICSLDEQEIRRWQDLVEVGNAYINRPITGAIVRRQPFGGWKRSSLGPGFKAGGPNYVLAFTELSDRSNGRNDYQRWWDEYFSQEHDPSGLRSESNVLRYRPSRGVLLRLDRDDAAVATLAAEAARVCGVPLCISLSDDESDAALASRLPGMADKVERLRYVRPLPDLVLRAAHLAGINTTCASISRHGRYELPRWLREQSISQTLHRYGLLLAEAPRRR